MEYTIVSIGALSHNRLWGEAGQLRTPHSTTVLVKLSKRQILVDPGLPAPILEARLNERTGLRLRDMTDVFCTTLRHAHRRGLEGLGGAKWWCHGAELESCVRSLQDMKDTAERLSNSQDIQAVQADLALLERMQPAADKLDEAVHLYPLPGASPGSAGLLLTDPTTTVLIAGDAALTAEHVRLGQVWEGCFDTEAAMESLQDMLQVADVIVPGHDNLFFVPRAWL